MKCIYFDNTCSGDRHIPYDPSEEDKKNIVRVMIFELVQDFKHFKKIGEYIKYSTRHFTF